VQAPTWGLRDTDLGGTGGFEQTCDVHLRVQYMQVTIAVRENATRSVHCGTMTTHPNQSRPSSNAVARVRDEQVLWLLERHPATAGMLAGIGLFPTQKKARRRLHRLVERKRVRMLGTVSLKCGRPEQVYGRGRWNGTNLLHEVQLTRVLLRIDASDVRRGPGEVDDYLRPDAEVVIGGVRYFLELDCGTMNYADMVRKRFARYRLSDRTVLWVCPTARRRDGLRSHAAGIRDTALFTTLDQALTDPHAAVWMHYDGHAVPLPRTSVGGVKAEFGPGAEGGA
jgi:hypothetical protein